jgi:hypothetical protein
MSTQPTFIADRTESSFDARWTRWQQAGAAQARLWDRRAAFIAALAFCAAAAWLAVAVYRS